MAIWCLPSSITAEFLKRLKSGEITPEKLYDMGDAGRHEYFKSFMGEANATKVNAQYESKLGLKNVKAGVISWAKSLTKVKEEVRKDIVGKAERMTDILRPENEQAFLTDLAETRLGMRVSYGEAIRIADLSENIVNTRKGMRPDYTFQTNSERLEHGRAIVDLIEYSSNLQRKVKKPFHLGRAIVDLGGLSKSLLASLDNSAIGRQGFKVMVSKPLTWLPNSLRTFNYGLKAFAGQDVLREVKADIASRPNALNGLYAKENLATGVIEESFPTSWPGKFPVFGRAFKASEAMFLGFQYRTRADLFDRYVQIAQKSGADTKGLGILVNTMTGRGYLGGAESSSRTLNNLFFSPRFVKSQFEFLSGHAFTSNAKMGAMAKKQAAKNLAQMVVSVSAAMAIAYAIDPDSVEFDPRSSDFGKIKYGNTRFDMTGGMASVVTLAARLATLTTKNSATDIYSSLGGDEFGSPTGLDMIYNFAEGKASPTSAMIISLLEQESRSGDPLSLETAIMQTMFPIPAQTYMETNADPNSANILLVMLAEEFGVSTSNYSTARDWNQSKSKELAQFREQVGDNIFEKEYLNFADKYMKRLKKLRSDNRYKRLSNEDKKRFISREQSELKQEIFDKHGFTYLPELKTELPRID